MLHHIILYHYNIILIIIHPITSYHFTPSLYHISHHIIMTSVYIISHCHFTHSYHIIILHHSFTSSIYHLYFISCLILILLLSSYQHILINHHSLICDLIFIYFHINSLFSSLSLF